MIALLFDTETDGLWDFKSHWARDVQPNLVQLAYKLVDLVTGHVYATSCNIVKTTRPIAPESIESHGITDAVVAKYGCDIEPVLDGFLTAYSMADYVIAHNYDFDQRVMRRAIQSHGKGIWVPTHWLCSMKATTELCKLKGKYGYKWPTLQELHEFLFHESFSGAHDALNDVNAMHRCIRRLIAINHFKLRTKNV